MSTNTQPIMNPNPGYSTNPYCFPVAQPGLPFTPQPTAQFVPVHLPPSQDTAALAWSQYAHHQASQRLSFLETQNEKCTTTATGLTSKISCLESQVKADKESADGTKKEMDILQNRLNVLSREHESVKKRIKEVSSTLETIKTQQAKKPISALSIFFLLITLVALAAFIVLMMCNFGLIPGLASVITGSAMGVAMGANALSILSLAAAGLVLVSSWAFFFTKK